MFPLIFITVIVVILALKAIKVIPHAHRGLVYRLGRPLPGAKGPGMVFMAPFIDTLKTASVEPFAISLPPQSAITADEIPLQIQASLKAEVMDAAKMLDMPNDWRILIVSVLQNLIKERLEEVDASRLYSDFQNWVDEIRAELEKRMSFYGIHVTELEMSNLSPKQ